MAAERGRQVWKGSGVKGKLGLGLTGPVKQAAEAFQVISTAKAQDIWLRRTRTKAACRQTEEKVARFLS